MRTTENAPERPGGIQSKPHTISYHCVVVGGGPAGATAANDLAAKGFSVLLLDRAGRTKPCGGAVPPKLIEEFAIPPELIVARVSKARMVAPSNQHVDIPIQGGYVGMVDRDAFDEWLRERACQSGAVRASGMFVRIDRDLNGDSKVVYEVTDSETTKRTVTVCAKMIIGADGALSAVARREIPIAKRMKYVFAYHEIVESPPADPTPAAADFDPRRCDVIYRGDTSPDFYSWVFPHGATTSIGTGSACKGFSLKGAVAEVRRRSGLSDSKTIRREGAPIPLMPLKRWDNGRDVVLAGDAAGVVAPASGEGIYYAMLSGRFAADAVVERLVNNDARALANPRKRFMKAHGRVFWILRMMQYFWYQNDGRRERFVSICRDTDVQQLTFDAYMNKKLVRAKPMAHVRIFIKDLSHLLGLVRT